MTSINGPLPGAPNGGWLPPGHSDAAPDAGGSRSSDQPALGRLTARKANAGQTADGSGRDDYSAQQLAMYLAGLTTAALDELWNTPRAPFSAIVSAHETFHRSLTTSGNGRDSNSVDHALDAAAEEHGIRHPMDHLLLFDTLRSGDRSEPAARAELEVMTGACDAVSQRRESADDAIARLGIAHSLDQELLRAIARQADAMATPPVDPDVLRRAESTVPGDRSACALLTVAILFGVRRDEQVRVLYDAQARQQIRAHLPTILHELNGRDGRDDT